MFKQDLIREVLKDKRLDKDLVVVANKDMRKMSNIVENLIRRYVESRV
tara:strand:+ start:397 stop:540 length:144 start_codon:yes stop_codon:yes gene_type:complete